MKSGLLISTYNWPEALELVLESVLLQTHLVNEILIADDGSRKETAQLIQKFQKRSFIPIRYFWHEDNGFRKSKILNVAIAETTVDYIIQIDGDCTLHSRFVEDHLNHAVRGTYLYGSRVNILPEFVEAIFHKKCCKFNLFSKEIKNKSRALHVPFLSRLYKAHDGISNKFRGCNVSFWRNDFIVVNGYNEDFEGWGREDSDLVIRLGNNHIKAKRLRYAGILYHIHHETNSKHSLEWNNQIQAKTIAEKVVACDNGINKYLKSVSC
jgi:hypothetical protein